MPYRATRGIPQAGYQGVARLDGVMVSGFGGVLKYFLALIFMEKC